MKKKYYLLFEMNHSVCFSSCYHDNIEDARKSLRMMVSRNDPLVKRFAVGFWEEIPCDDGNLKIFHICAECHRISK